MLPITVMIVKVIEEPLALKAAVEAGEITEEQAKERLDAYSKSLDQRVTKGVSVRKEE